MQQHFEILELGDTATKVDVQIAFRRLSKMWHPDVNMSPNAPEMFKSICEARDHLLIHFELVELEEKMSFDIPLDSESETGASTTKSTDHGQSQSHSQQNPESGQSGQKTESPKSQQKREASQTQQTNESGQTKSRVPPPPRKRGPLAGAGTAIATKFYAIPWSFVFCSMLAAIILCRILGLL
jgi:DnaJ-class molecular chaperone